jgi:5-methylcytosine-specific restriction endonuclease McrA
MPKARVTSAKRRLVIDRAQDRCEYCQCRSDYATETYAADHVIPVSRGGSDEVNNLALACSGCNGRKYNKQEVVDPATGEMVPLFNPRLQRWEDHFAWSKDYTQIIGLTAIGRATTAALQMNRQSVVNIRKAMFVMGLHPPVISA